MKYSKTMALVFALVLALGVVACGETDDDDGEEQSEQDDNDNDSDSDEPTVAESEYVDTCVDHADSCDSAQGDESDCENLWEADLEGASQPGACVDARVEGWDCMMENDCGEEAGCQEIFADIGSYCTPE